MFILQKRSYDRIKNLSAIQNRINIFLDLRMFFFKVVYFCKFLINNGIFGFRSHRKNASSNFKLLVIVQCRYYAQKFQLAVQNSILKRYIKCVRCVYYFIHSCRVHFQILCTTKRFHFIYFINLYGWICVSLRANEKHAIFLKRNCVRSTFNKLKNTFMSIEMSKKQRFSVLALKVSIDINIHN